MNPVGRLQLMSHQKKTDRAIILVHGYTSCPQQFHELGLRFFSAGYNVLIAPLPHHGLADPMTKEQSRLTAGELAAYADRTVDIARGLGNQVIMMGLSAGGVTTAWAAQNRNDVDLAVIISPAFGFKKVPSSLTAAAMNIYGFLPDVFEWWDPVLKEKVLPAHGYPQYSRHALVEILRLGFAVKDEARHKTPAAGKIVLIYNANDNMINNDVTEELATVWQEHYANLKTCEFNSRLKLTHDLIDPAQPNQRIDIVYPLLMELVSR
jgi:carboxylesterase